LIRFTFYISFKERNYFSTVRCIQGSAMTLERSWEEYSSDESRTYDCEVDVCTLQDLEFDEILDGWDCSAARECCKWAQVEWEMWRVDSLHSMWTAFSDKLIINGSGTHNWRSQWFKTQWFICVRKIRNYISIPNVLLQLFILENDKKIRLFFLFYCIWRYYQINQ